jgi:nucleoside-diphosphate-sugar epimerase
MKIGLIGASGFVGNSIFNQFAQLVQFECVPIIKGDNFESKIRDVDFVIHCANSAKRFFANSNPDYDRSDTLGKTKKFLDSASDKPFLLVSSISCRTQLDTPYGINRKGCEDMVLEYGGSVVRLGPMFGTSRVRDVVHDICESKKVFVSKDSKQSFSSVEWNGLYIAKNFASWSGIVEIGARGTISLGDLAAYANSRSEFIGESDDQFPLNFETGPDVLEVLGFVDQIMEQQKRLNAQ